MCLSLETCSLSPVRRVIHVSHRRNNVIYYNVNDWLLETALVLIQCPRVLQPCGSITPLHCSLVWVWTCSGATYLPTVMTKRTRTVTKTRWLQLEPFRHWRGHFTRWRNFHRIIGTFTVAGWFSAFKSELTATVCRPQRQRRTLAVHYPACHSPNLDECAEKPIM